MIKETITYTDYNGNERTEDFYFHLSKAELMDMELESLGGFSQKLQTVIDSNDPKEIVETFKDIIIRSYGEKSADGLRFIKSKEITDAFVQTEAYSELFIKLATDSDAAARFANGILP